VTRLHLPNHIRDLVLLESGYRCAVPTCRQTITLQVHHIIRVADDGGNSPDNLIALCPNCHALHHAGHIPLDAIKIWKTMLVSLNEGSRSNVDLLLVLSNEEDRIAKAAKKDEEPPPFRFTGDSLPAIAGMLTSGLIEISKRYLGGSAWSSPSPSFEVALTSKGRKLVNAWKEGNYNAAEEVINLQGRTTINITPKAGLNFTQSNDDI
jgi:hypothetical protein